MSDSKPLSSGGTRSESQPFAQINREKNRHAIRWYVLTLPMNHRGAIRSLQAECTRRARNNEPALEFFAPTYEEVQEKEGAWIKTNRPLLYNYVFIRASENEIWKMKMRALSPFNFLPRVGGSQDGHYPYLPDETMINLQWVARAYSNVIPVCYPNPDRLMKGDRVRITEGEFKDAEASVVIQPGPGAKSIMVCVENWMLIPLLHVKAGQYEIISLNTDNQHLYTKLNNDRLFLDLHHAIQRYYTAKITDADCALAAKILRQYGNLKMNTDVTRSKLYALLLPAYTILGNRNSCDQVIGTMQQLLTNIKAPQSQALLLVTLYGCTDNYLYYSQAHTLVDPWRTEPEIKKNKQQLIMWLDDYDRWLGH